MANYFTISEFAKLRNININSLRYYEKIGVLKPAYVDPKTGYRYYSPDQLALLDVILLCIDFGLPLKDLVKYISNDESIRNKELFETGRSIAKKRLRAAQMELDKIDYTLQYLEVNRQYSTRTGLYQRAIPERTVVTMDYEGDLADIHRIEMTSGKLYHRAQEDRLSPVFPAGLLINIAGNTLTTKVFFEIMNRDGAADSIETLPAGIYRCRQIDLTPSQRLTDTIDATFGAVKEAQIVVSNMLLDKYQIGTKKSELQKRIECNNV